MCAVPSGLLIGVKEPGAHNCKVCDLTSIPICYSFKPKHASVRVFQKLRFTKVNKFPILKPLSVCYVENILGIPSNLTMIV